MLPLRKKKSKTKFLFTL